jgi:hypothetical protein
MNEPQENPQAGGERGMHDQCACNQLLDHFRGFIGVSRAAKQHLSNSRIEFLKVIREVIDERIEHLSTKSQQGTKIAVGQYRVGLAVLFFGPIVEAANPSRIM